MTTVRKRDPRATAEYYVSGSTVRRNAPSAQNAERRPTQWVPAQWEPIGQDPATRRYSREEAVRTRRSETARRVGEKPQQRPMARQAAPMREEATRRDPRREQTRAYYQAQMEAEVQRRAREEHNMRTLERHRAWQRAAEERRRKEEEARIAAEEMAEQRRRAQQRVRTIAAVLTISLVLTVAGAVFALLMRYITIDDMTRRINTLENEIREEEMRVGELQVEINKQSNIADVKDYAQESLNMDYAQEENIRTIVLPGE